MNLINDNENGRVFINEFLVSKVIYKYILENYKDIELISVKYHDNVVTYNIKNSLNLSMKYFNELQTDTIVEMKNKLGLYVADVNINIG